MDENQPQAGVSVKEIETFAKKHRFKLFFCLTFVLALSFALIMYSSGWSTGAAALGGILGIVFPSMFNVFALTILGFFFKQQKTTRLVLAIVFLILAIFLPPLIFLMIGIHGGKDIYFMLEDKFRDQQNQRP